MEEENQQDQEPQVENVDTSSSGGKNGLLITVVIIALIALAGGVYFLSKKSSGSLSTTTENPTTTVSSPAATSDQPVKEITVSGKEFSFSPEKLTVNKGDRVKLVFKNEGKMQHDFVIDEFGVATKVIEAGGEDTIEFTPTDTGTFKFYCSVNDHRAKGMEGTLEVK